MYNSKRYLAKYRDKSMLSEGVACMLSLLVVCALVARIAIM